MYCISSRYIRNEEGVKTGRTLNGIITIGEGIGHLVEKEITIVIEVMDMAEDISEKVVSEVGAVVILEEIIIAIEIEKKGGLGHSQDQEKEE